MTGSRTIEIALLCGGLGSRLRGISGDIPKPMVPIDGKPFLERLIEQAAQQGFGRFIFCTGYRGGSIEKYFSASERKHECYFSRETKPLGTAGAVKLCESFIHGECFIVLNGDSYCSMDFDSLIDFHVSNHAAASLAVVPSRARTDGGYIEIDENKRIRAFGEKKYDPDRFLNAGVYIFNRSVFDMIPENRSVSLEENIFPRLIEKGFYAFETSGPLYDIGTPERLKEFKRATSFEKALK